MTACAECGADSCEELFHRVLALDHSRRPPWGPLHGVTVACYLLQHPSRLPERDRPRVASIVRTFLDEGLAGVAVLTEKARQDKSHRRWAVDAPAPAAAFDVTIADVAQDGTFPADGFPERVRAWARAVLPTHQQM